MLGNRSTYFSEVERGRPGTGRGSRRKRARERSGGKPRNRVPGHSACTSGNAADGCARVKERAAEPGTAGEGGKHSSANAHSTCPFRPLHRKSTCAINWCPPPLRRLDPSL